MEEAIATGPHILALHIEAMQQLQMEAERKATKGQCRVMLWDDIKQNPPEHLKVLRSAMIPHKLRKF